MRYRSVKVDGVWTFIAEDEEIPYSEECPVCMPPGCGRTDFYGGKRTPYGHRGKCPACGGKGRIPLA